MLFSTPVAGTLIIKPKIHNSVIVWDCVYIGLASSQVPPSCYSNNPITSSPIVDPSVNYSNRTDSPIGEESIRALDDNPNTKFLTFDPSDATLDVEYDSPQYASSLTITSANDTTLYPGRDPKTVSVYGVNSSGVREFISTVTLDAFTANKQAQTVDIDRLSNTNSYSNYQVQFESTQDTNASELQLSDLKFS